MTSAETIEELENTLKRCREQLRIQRALFESNKARGFRDFDNKESLVASLTLTAKELEAKLRDIKNL